MSREQSSRRMVAASVSSFGRRRFLGLLGATASATAIGVLGACQPQTVEKPVEVTRVVERVVEKPVEVPRVVEKVVVATAVPKQQVVELKLSTDWNSPTRKAVLDIMKGEFEKANQNVKIEHWHMGSGGTSGAGGYSDIIVAQLVTGTAADVIGNFSFGPYTTHIAELTKDAPTAGWKKEEVVYDAPNQEIDGKLYMLSMSASVAAWAYNKTMFKEAGVKEPEESWTLDDVFETAAKLTVPAKKQYGVYATNNPPQFGWVPMFWAAGAGQTGERSAQLIDVEKKQSRLAEGNAPDAFQWWIDLIYKQKYSPAPGEIASLASGGVTHPFAAGKIAMFPFDAYNAGGMVNLVGDRFEWSLMKMPINPKTGRRAFDLHSEGWVIPKVAQKRNTYETALKYVVSFYSDPVQKAVALNRASLPTARKWIPSPEFTKAPPLNMDLVAKTLDDPKAIIGDMQRRLKVFGPWYQAVRNEIDRAFVGDVPAKDALNAAVKAGNEVLAKN